MTTTTSTTLTALTARLNSLITATPADVRADLSTMTGAALDAATYALDAANWAGLQEAADADELSEPLQDHLRNRVLDALMENAQDVDRKLRRQGEDETAVLEVEEWVSTLANPNAHLLEEPDAQDALDLLADIINYQVERLQGATEPAPEPVKPSRVKAARAGERHPKVRIPGLPEDVRQTVRDWSEGQQDSPLYLAVEQDGRMFAQVIPGGTQAHLVGDMPAWHVYKARYNHLLPKARAAAVDDLEGYLRQMVTYAGSTPAELREMAQNNADTLAERAS